MGGVLSPRLRLVLWPAGGLLGLAAVWLAFDWGEPERWVPDLIVGWTFIGAGLVVAARHRASACGVLMVATGFTWFVPNFAAAAPGLEATLAAGAIYLHRGPLIHLLLGYPGGRMPSLSAWVVVGAGYAASVAPVIWSSEVATVVLALSVVIVAVRLYRHAVARARRARLLALIAASGFAVAVVGGAAARLALPDGAVSYAALVGYQVTLVAIGAVLAAGLVTSFWERADLADLVVELGADRPRTVRAALARAIGDPSLEIGYWMPDTASFVDTEGRPLTLPDSTSQRSVTVVERSGEPLAALVHDPAVLDDPALLEAVTSAAQLAAANARLQAEVRGRVADVEASRRRILSVRDDERRRLERRLHDGAELRLDQLRQTLGSGLRSTSDARTIERISRAETQLAATVDNLRQLARGLHPRILTEQGLQTAVTSLTEGVPMPVQVSVTAEQVPPDAQVAAYFVCAEALANVGKHASASEARVSVSSDGSRLTVVIEDDGVGGAGAASGSGLRGLADRIETLGGTLSVSDAEGGGTRVAAEIPLGDGATRGTG